MILDNFYVIIGALGKECFMNTGVNYKLFYEILLNLRESFHSYGRIDDSNSKLDEIVKLILLSYYKAKKGEKFTLELVKKYAQENHFDEIILNVWEGNDGAMEFYRKIGFLPRKTTLELKL